MVIYKNQLYVGGDFSMIGNLTTNCIARFDYLPIGIERIFNSSPIIIYPNPAQSAIGFKIKLLNKNISSIANLSIYSMTGVLIHDFGEILKEEDNFNSSLGLQPGSYVVKVRLNTSEYFSQLLIIQ